MLPDEVKNLLASDYGMTIKAIKYLSQGDNGSVCLIEDTAGRKMCVKSISVSNPSAMNDFEIVKIMYESSDFNVRCYTDNEFHHIVMPFFTGEHLGKMIAMNLPMPVRETIMKKLILAVDRLHILGILHRDLKAENVMVHCDADDNVEVNIIDFGRSVRIFDHETGRALATPETLSLVSTTRPKSWSAAFYPVCQFFRKWQPQTAPELSTISSHYFGYAYEAEGVGLRTDYYAIANLFQALLPEQRDLVNDILRLDGPERSTAYRAFAKSFMLSSPDTFTSRLADAPQPSPHRA